MQNRQRAGRQTTQLPSTSTKLKHESQWLTDSNMQISNHKVDNAKSGTFNHGF